MTKVSTTGSYRIPGIYEPIEYIVETHTICDKCGSGDISYKANAYVPGFINGVFSLIIILSFCGFFISGIGGMILRIFKYNLIVFGSLITFVIAFFVFGFLTAFVERNNNKNQKCNKCGNEHIT